MNWLLLSLLLATSDAAARPVDFDTQIEPLLTRFGCNAGSCHGAAAGRGGFSLSLYGSVPERDHEAIAQQLEGRRINLSQPNESLLFLKATESIPHGGGPRFDIDDDAATLLLNWIRQGADRSDDRQLQSLQITPETIHLETLDETVRIAVQVTFSDGESRDVTAWSVLTPDDAATLDVRPNGEVSARRPGRHLLTARYLDRLVPVEVLLPLAPFMSLADQNAAPAADVEWPEGDNVVDREVRRRVRELRLPNSPDATPTTFLRRATLRLTGRLPTLDSLDAFPQACDVEVASSEQKLATQRIREARNKLVDELLASEAFEKFWTFQFVRLLRIRSQPQHEDSARTVYEWLRKQIAADRPLDQVARELITATGDTRQNGATAFYLAASDARQQAEFASELFLGVRLRCANCHDHPLDQWTQDDYHGLAAIFAPVRRGASVTVATSGTVIHPRTGEPAIPKLPGDRFLSLEEAGDAGLRVFAEWLTSRENGWFDRAVANRVWKLLMGRGLVEPVDDLRVSNAPTHPKLLDELAGRFAAGGRRLRPLIRLICQSRTFGRSSVPAHSDLHDEQFYSHALAVELEPEVLFDAVADVTGTAPTFPPTVAAGGRAVNLVARDVASDTLDVLGRCPVDAECSSASESTDTLPRALLLINGEFLNSQLAAPSGILSNLLAAGTSDRELVWQFYRRALSRNPASEELDFWTNQLQRADDERQRRAIAEDFLWALLTCREFMTCR
ncbi:DUF1553 domain-containing protein [bacterium]|nr:DUF1553 domain-containing protein [bacterium]